MQQSSVRTVRTLLVSILNLQNDSVVIPEIAVEDLMPMDKIGMDLMIYMRRIYLVIAD